MFSILFFQAEDGIRYLVRSRGLGDVYKRQGKLPWKKLVQPSIDLAKKGFIMPWGLYKEALAVLSLIHI